MNVLFNEKQYSLFVFLSGLQSHFSSMLAPKEETWRNWCASQSVKVVFQRLTRVCLYRLVAGCHQPHQPAKGQAPLETPSRSALRFSLDKRRKGMKKNSGNTQKFQCRRTVRITRAEDEKLQRQAAIAHISVAEYMRRRFFGGRPIIARTDDQTIRELRRLGGLLKHHFDVVKRTGNAATLAELDAVLRVVRRAIEALSETR